MSAQRITRSASRARSQPSVVGDTPSATPAQQNTAKKTTRGSTEEQLTPLATVPSMAYGSQNVAQMPGAVSMTDQSTSFAEVLQQEVSGAKKPRSKASSRGTRKATPAKVSTVDEETEPESPQQPAAASATPGEGPTTFNKEVSGFGHVPPPAVHGEPEDPASARPPPAIAVNFGNVDVPPRSAPWRKWLRCWWEILPVLAPYLLLLLGAMGIATYWGVSGVAQGLARVETSVGGLAERLTVLESDVFSIRSEGTVEYSSSTQQWRQETVVTPPHRMVNFFATGLGAVVDPYYTSPTMYPPSTWKQDLANRVFFLGRPNPNPPVAALEGWEDIGDCWCSAHSKYGKAQLAVLMPRTIYPTQVTVEHIPATATLDIGAAPREMELWAQIHDEDARGQITRSQDLDSEEYQEAIPGISLDPTFVRIASWQYDIHSDSNVQTFPVQVDLRSFGVGVRRVIVRAKSNNGTSEYTCLYRIRMHGELLY
ncbi:MAG: hypothetical protein M1836_006229 [Candelina mexicana]|nr:MAG: hypothetical protein M1836_006229 [Candelina mexicana]